VRRSAVEGFEQKSIRWPLFLAPRHGSAAICSGVGAWLLASMGLPGGIRCVRGCDHPVSDEKRPEAPGAACACGANGREGEQSKDHTDHHAVLVVSALDHRLAWTPLPPDVSLAGDALVALGFLIVFLVYKENTFASATIELAPEQKVISTGLYKLVRHPMYMGAFLLFVGIPLSLGSLWGLLVIALMLPAFIWRLLNEEKFLVKNLPGYAEYQNTVRHRLLPFLW
jgi:protein-S-isoprenylcysteine O-methyltransferase Ste14